MIILLGLLALSAPAHAECGYLSQKLQEKRKIFDTYVARNNSIAGSFFSWKNGCRDQGADLSAKIASAAASLSCTAELDGSGLDAKLSALGARCEGGFLAVRDSENSLHTAFTLIKDDFQEQHDVGLKSELMHELCEQELRDTHALFENMIALQISMVQLERDSEEGRGSYLEFKERAAGMATMTGKRGEGCGALAASLSAAVAAAAKPPVPAGESANPASTITGDKKEAKLLEAAKAPGVSAEEARMLLSVAGPMGKSGKGTTAELQPAAPASALASADGPGSAATFNGFGKLNVGAVVSRSPASAAAAPPVSIGDAIWKNVNDGTGAKLELIVAAASADAKDGSAALQASEEKFAGAGSSVGTRDQQADEASIFEKVSSRYRRLERMLNPSTLGTRVAQE